MNNSIKYYLGFIFFLVSLLSCKSLNEPQEIIEQISFLNELKNIELPMNSISPEYTLLINKSKFAITDLNYKITSNDTNIISHTGIIAYLDNDTLKFNIKPEFQKYGEVILKLEVADKANIDSLKIAINVTYDSENDNYPTKLYKYSDQELFQLQNRCEFEIDNYGLVSYSGTLSRGKSDISNADSAMALVRDKIIQLKEFTNVEDKDFLLLDNAKKSGSGPSALFTDWVIKFKNQIYNGYEVEDTWILSVVNNGVVSLKGHHYKNIFIPKTNKIPKERITEILTGYVINYYCWEEKSLIITEELLTKQPTEIIYCQEIQDHIELRVVWKVPIQDSYSPTPYWYVLVDVLSGEIIQVLPTFIC